MRAHWQSAGTRTWQSMVRYGVRVQDPVRFLDSIGERLVSDELTPAGGGHRAELLLLMSALEEERNAAMPSISKIRHQYIERATGAVAEERLMANRIIQTLYSPKLENAPLLAKLASSRKVSEVLGYLNYDNAAVVAPVGDAAISAQLRHRCERIGGRAG